MVHNWNETTKVYPRSAIRVEEEGNFISNYIALKPTKLVQSYPTVYLRKNARTSLNSIIYSHTDSVYDVGGRAVLEEEGARAEIMSRSVSSGGNIIARAHVNTKADNTFGHVECSSLMLDDKGHVHAIPELESNRRNVVLSHEALIGKIAEEEIYYLMSRGISEEEAISLIVRGFLNIEIEGLPDMINAQIRETLKLLEDHQAL
jgi:Fe-S cluster assembly scaffold protein SufB